MTGRSRNKLRSPSEVQEDFRRAGITVSQWARKHGFKPNLVFEVLAGRAAGSYGQSHRIAVRLGLKRGAA